MEAGNKLNYINGKDVFPSELLDLIQNYTQGNYVYIPKREQNKEMWGAKTSYRTELRLRNGHIYTHYLTGFSFVELGNKYCLSVKSIRRIISKKRKEAQEMKVKIEKLLDAWNINLEINQIYDSAWSIGNDYIIKTNSNLENLNRNITIMKTLYECGIPVAVPIKTTSGDDFLEHDDKYYLIMNKLPGTHILDIYHTDYFTISYETGKILAKLHSAFISCEQKITLWDNNFLDEMSGWVHSTLKTNNYRYISEFDFKTTLNELKECYSKLPKQLIHRDMHYGNILFNNDQFSGYIDFDLSQKNVRIFDICYFLIGLLIDHEKNKDHIQIWYNIVSRFIEGYEVSNQLTKIEKDSICCLISCIELLFIAYFLDMKDEILAQSAANLYYFINTNKNRIQSIINGHFVMK